MGAEGERVGEVGERDGGSEGLGEVVDAQRGDERGQNGMRRARKQGRLDGEEGWGEVEAEVGRGGEPAVE